MLLRRFFCRVACAPAEQTAGRAHAHAAAGLTRRCPVSQLQELVRKTQEALEQKSTEVRGYQQQHGIRVGAADAEPPGSTESLERDAAHAAGADASAGGQGILVSQ